MIIGDLFAIFVGGPFFWLVFLFVLVLLRALLRRQWAATTFVVLIMAGLQAGSSDPVAGVAGVIFVALAVFALTRFGLLTMLSNWVIFNLLMMFPLTLQVSAWYADISLAGILLMAAMALYGFYTSLGGRPVFGGAVLEE